MYKVFVNERPLIFVNTKKDANEACLSNVKEMNFKQIVDQLYNNQLKKMCIYHPEIKEIWALFTSSFKIEKAAGGLVYNDNNELLFIHRLGKWDLPKGHIEKGESKKNAAIREVEEECGISKLKIQNKMPTTYHMFIRNGDMVLKITYWYQMFSSDKGRLVPQTEEDIDAVCFKSKPEALEALKNSYENIVELLKTSRILN